MHSIQLNVNFIIVKRDFLKIKKNPSIDVQSNFTGFFFFLLIYYWSPKILICGISDVDTYPLYSITSVCHNQQ